MNANREFYQHALAPNVGVGPVHSNGPKEYVGTPMDDRRTRAYGGSQMAQALLAIMNDINDVCRPRSVTMAFLKASDGSAPTTFTLDACARGRSIATYQFTSRSGKDLTCAGQVSLDIGEPRIAPIETPARTFAEAGNPDDARSGAVWPDVSVVAAERMERFESRHAWEVRFGTEPPREQSGYPFENVLWVRPQVPCTTPAWVGDLLLAHASDFYVPGMAAATRGGFLTDGWMATTVTHTLWTLGAYVPGTWIRIRQSIGAGAGERVLVDQELTDDEGRVLARAMQEALVREVVDRKESAS